MTPIEQGFLVIFVLIVCFWAVVMLVDDWRNDGGSKP